MATTRFLHAADIHLDSPLTGLAAYPNAPVQELRTATRRAFAELVNRAIEERVDFLVIAGDLYDGSWKDFNTGLYFAHQMGRLRGAGIPAVVLHGNHDAESEITRTLQLPNNVHVLAAKAPETVRFEHLKVAVHGQGFREKKMTDNLAVHYPEPIPGWLNVGVLHTALQGHDGHEPYAPCSLEELRAKGYQYWALGHVHEYTEVCDRPRVVFPGNLQGRNVRETGPRGAVLVTAEDDQIVQVSRVILDVLRWEHLRIDVSTCSTWEDMVARAETTLREAVTAAEGRTVAVRVTFYGSTCLHGRLFGQEREVRNEVLTVGATLGTGSVWVEKVRVETTPAVDEATLLARSDAISELCAVLAEAVHDVDLMTELRRELSDVIQRVPPDVRASEATGIAAITSSRVEDLVSQVTSGLLARVSE